MKGLPSEKKETEGVSKQFGRSLSDKQIKTRISHTGPTKPSPPLRSPVATTPPPTPTSPPSSPRNGAGRPAPGGTPGGPPGGNPGSGRGAPPPTPPSRSGRRTTTGGPNTTPRPQALQRSAPSTTANPHPTTSTPPVRPLPTRGPAPGGRGAPGSGINRIRNFDDIWNEFQKIAMGDGENGSNSLGSPSGMRPRQVEKMKKLGRISGKFASPVQIRRTASMISSKLDTMSDLVNQGRQQVFVTRNRFLKIGYLIISFLVTQDFIGAIGDVLINLNTVSAGLKEMNLVTEKQVLVTRIRSFVLASKDRYIPLPSTNKTHKSMCLNFPPFSHNNRMDNKIGTNIWQDQTTALSNHLKKIQSLIPETHSESAAMAAQPDFSPPPAEELGMPAPMLLSLLSQPFFTPSYQIQTSERD